MFACFRAGAVFVPTNFRQTPDEVAYLAKASGAVGMICNAAFPDHAARVRASLHHRDRRRRLRPRTTTPSSPSMPGPRRGRPIDRDDPCWFFFTSGTTGRPKAVGAHPRPDGLRRHQPPLRPDAGPHPGRRLARRGPAVARRRRAPARPGRPRREDGADADRAPRHRRRLGADRALARLDDVHRADDPQAARRARERRRPRPFLAALRHLRRRADVPRGPEARARRRSAPCSSSTSASAR